MIYFTAHTFKCVCHCRRAMFRVLGMYNFAPCIELTLGNRKELISKSPKARNASMFSPLSPNYGPIWLYSLF